MSSKSLLDRLVATSRENGPKTHRIRDVLSTPFKGRHITNFVKGNRMVDGVPLFDAMVIWRIKQSGLRISTGAGAVYGDGAYCLAGKASPPSAGHFYIDIEIPTGVGVEQISIQGISLPYYRFLPADGDVIAGVKILDTNISMDVVDKARDFMNQG